MLVFGVPSDMTRIEFKKKCNEVGLYCFEIGKVEREGEHFRATLTPNASTEWQRIDRKSVGWVRRLGWRVCITNGIAELRRSPKVNGDKGSQEIANGPKDMGENNGGVEQTDKDKARNRSRNTVHSRENRKVVSTEKEQIDRSRLDSQAKNKLRTGSRKVSGFAAEEHKRLEIVEQVSNRDLDIVGIQESWGKEGGAIGCKVGEYAWIGKKRKGQDSKNRGAGAVKFLVQ